MDGTPQRRRRLCFHVSIDDSNPQSNKSKTDTQPRWLGPGIESKARQKLAIISKNGSESALLRRIYAARVPPFGCCRLVTTPVDSTKDQATINDRTNLRTSTWPFELGKDEAVLSSQPRVERSGHTHIPETKEEHRRKGVLKAEKHLQSHEPGPYLGFLVAAGVWILLTN